MRTKRCPCGLSAIDQHFGACFYFRVARRRQSKGEDGAFDLWEHNCSVTRILSVAIFIGSIRLKCWSRPRLVVRQNAFCSQRASGHAGRLFGPRDSKLDPIYLYGSTRQLIANVEVLRRGGSHLDNFGYLNETHSIVSATAFGDVSHDHLAIRALLSDHKADRGWRRKTLTGLRRLS